ncbi:hypothetical protein HMI54_000832 [Coelomomyces lativittatus]|nr:hypothetical protein HMI56_002228 [Coelomomyces lativittatus]KAJ1510555.1 hypothetical protein HMI55_006952 [Coelomomyces lativittatus]KAJ1511427.1 hypothetical protein HMI54_000832 [Coelomomyces lativittatus]
MCSQFAIFQCDSPFPFCVTQSMSQFTFITLFFIIFAFHSSTYAQMIEKGYLFGLADKECSGISLASSKYCSGFAPNFLAPTNIVPGLLYLLNFREDDDAAAIPYIQANYDKLKSVTDFDKVFSDTIFPNAHIITSRQTSCPYKNYGVQGFTTYACQWLVNYGVIFPSPQNWFQTTCVSKIGLGRNQGLCLATSNDFITSARTNFDKDPSCSSNSKNQMLSRTEAYFETSKRVSNRNDNSSNCISWQLNESALNLCGFFTKTQACLNNCKVSNLDCTQVLNGYVMLTDSSSSSSSSSTLKTILIVVAVIVVILIHVALGVFIYLRIKKIPLKDFLQSLPSMLSRNKTPQTQSSPVATPWLTYDTPKDSLETSKAEENSMNSINDDLRARDSLFATKASPLSSNKATGAPKFSLPTSIITNNSPLPGTLKNPTEGGGVPPLKPPLPSLMESGLLSGLHSTTSSWAKPKSSLLSQPPLTMPSTPDDDDKDDDSHLPLSATSVFKNPKFTSPVPSQPRGPVPSPSFPSNDSLMEEPRTSLSSFPLPRHIPSTIDSGPSIPSLLTSQLPPPSLKPGTTEPNGKSRTLSLVSTQSTDSVLFRRETLLRANSLLSTSILVKFEFEPARNDEIALSPGDKVVVITRYEDGWGWGCKYDKVTGKESVGAFPLNCLEDHAE